MAPSPAVNPERITLMSSRINHIGLFKNVLPHRKRCFHFLLSKDRRLFRIGRLPSKPMNSVNPLHWAEPTQKYQGAVPFRCVKS